MLDLSGPILFSGENGAGIDVDAVIAGLNANRSAAYVDVQIDSEGGALIEGKKLYAALRAHPGYKITHAGRLCASSATLILMAGDFRTCDANTQFMIHEPEVRAEQTERWTASRHSRIAADLRRISAELVKIYSERTGRNAKLFECEIQHEKLMAFRRAQRLGLVHCLAGEQRWINGRPYSFPDWPSSITENVIASFSPAELQAIARKDPPRWRNSPIGHLAFTGR
ncbi:MAG: ATP-dependent Clp protease proteolytic subunit [Pseudomonadota bacterium]